MSFSKLIINNVLRSHRTYLGYFLSSTFSVFVFFIFAILNFHPQLKSGLGENNNTIAEFAQMGMFVSQFLIICLSFIFLWYSFRTFIKSRQKDLSIYVMLGIRPRDLQRLLFGENMVIGIGAITLGTLLGLIFMKVILIFIQSLLNITTGLTFYFPTFGIFSTVIIYLFLFLLVSFLLVLKIETTNLTQLNKSEEMPEPLPKVRFIYMLLAFLFIGSGYSAWAYFVLGKNDRNILILFFVTFTIIIGTFLFFHQVGVFYYLQKRQSSYFWKKENFLLTAEGIYRAKENANLFALITCTATVALIGVLITSTLGSYESASKNSLPAAFVLSSPQIFNSDTTPISENIGEDILSQIKKAGYQAILTPITTYSFNFKIPSEGSSYYGSLMRVSDYNRLAKQLQLETLQITENELFAPAYNTNSIAEVLQSQIVEIPKTNQENNQMFYKLTLTDAPFAFQLLNTEEIWIASDTFVDTFLKERENEPIHGRVYQVIDFPGWEKAPQLNNQIIDELNQKSHLFEEKMEALHTAFEEGKLTNIEYEKKWDEIYQSYFEFTSLYNNWKMKQQTNGFILIISLLLGGVFFLFTASILYFRLFGDLDKQGRYHRILYQIGLTPKMRRKIITSQLLTMYFLPLLLATLHSAVAFWGLVQLSRISLWRYYWVIIAIYFILQIILFGFSRWRYLIHLDLRAENPQTS